MPIPQDFNAYTARLLSLIDDAALILAKYLAKGKRSFWSKPFKHTWLSQVCLKGLLPIQGKGYSTKSVLYGVNVAAASILKVGNTA